MRHILIWGSHGQMIVDRKSGFIIEKNLNCTEYDNIHHFDAVSIAHASGPERHDRLDILSVGYWTRSGSYAVPLTMRLQEDSQRGMYFDDWVECAQLPGPDNCIQKASGERP